MGSRAPFAIGEWYHCFNRGVDKRLIFEDRYDYERFLLLAYISNGTNGLRASQLYTTNLDRILGDSRIHRGEPLVEFGAYALMPNHFHFIFQEARAGGIATYMQRLCTGYTMYFNNRRERSGALLAGTFKSRHITDDDYLKRTVSYVLLNPAELFEPRWKEGFGDISMLRKRLSNYPYTSLSDFLGQKRPANAIVGKTLFTYYEKLPSLQEMLHEAQNYYRELQV